MPRETRGLMDVREWLAAGRKQRISRVRCDDHELAREVSRVMHLGWVVQRFGPARGR